MAFSLLGGCCCGFTGVQVCACAQHLADAGCQSGFEEKSWLLQARRLPVETLTRVVRAAFEPHEYPATMARLVAWTPDEAIPEFYDDEIVFESAHGTMPDLAVPDWASSNANFIRRHRHAR